MTTRSWRRFLAKAYPRLTLVTGIAGRGIGLDIRQERDFDAGRPHQRQFCSQSRHDLHDQSPAYVIRRADIDGLPPQTGLCNSGFHRRAS